MCKSSEQKITVHEALKANLNKLNHFPIENGMVSLERERGGRTMGLTFI